MSFAIAYHGHCFDGMSSAVLLTRFLRARHGRGLEISYRGLDHQPGGSHVPDRVLCGRENAVLDFRYTTSPRLTWFFDHHVSGLAGDEERAHLLSDTTGQKFFDPTYGSCTKLIADTLKERFDFDVGLPDLVRWAHLIDTAAFPSAEAAVKLAEPALRLMAVIEAYGSDKFLSPRIVRLSEGTPIEEVADEHRVKKLFRPIERMHAQTKAQIEERATCEDGVVSFDLVGNGHERYNKFIPYGLFPECRYAVALTATSSRVKISVGSNPWATVPRTHDIAAICSVHGGGGHPVVGAVSLPSGEIERARSIAADICAVLRSEPSA